MTGRSPGIHLSHDLRLFSERRLCDSCEGVIAQFRADFPPPDVQLVVSEGER
ncbi:MAG: hypothetical protein KY476_20280 [Planctomycetes bacterium]|nr:hypothetical protein [Planctomycetota bacterium]